MDPEREIPLLIMNEFKAKRLIVESLKENGETDVRNLWYKFYPEGWADVYGTTVEDLKKYRKAGIYEMNSYFELLESLVKDGTLIESVDPRLEGGIEGVPRYSYKLA